MQRKSYSKYLILGGLIAAIIFLIFLNSLGWLEAPKNIIFRGSAPILKPFRVVALKISGSIKLLADLKDLSQENTDLKQENQELVLKSSRLVEIQQENDVLKKQLQVKPPLESKLALASVVGYSSGNFGQYILIDRGKSDGIRENQGVIFAGGFLAGKVFEVNDHLSKVLLIVDSKSAIPAIIQETRIGGTIRGDHGVGLIMEVVSQQKNIKEGELVVSSGLDGYLPKGLIIGQIGRRISIESEPFQQFEIKMAINFLEMESVFAIIGNE